MRNAIMAATLVHGGLIYPALANDDLMKHLANPAEQVLQTVDYANTRYSKLDQINAGNVKNLQVAWTFSTGV
ncbi:hypothetical protein FV225_26230, partial [Methylobacterium sp. WL93]